MFHFYIPCKRPKTSGFMAFTGGIEMIHPAKIGSNNAENLSEMNNPRFLCTNTNAIPSKTKECEFRHFIDTKLIQSNSKLNHFIVFLLII